MLCFANKFQSMMSRAWKLSFLLVTVLAALWCFPDASNLHATPLGRQQAGNTKQTQASPTKKEGQSTTPLADSAAAEEESDLANVQAEAKAVQVPDVQALAKALGIDLSPAGDDPADSPTNSLQELGDLDGDGISEFALKLMPSMKREAPEGAGTNRLPSWQLILLAWDGARWQASRIQTGFELYELQVLSSLIPGSKQLALTVYSGARAIPFPAIYQIKDHAAALMWDGRSDESLYEGFVQGRLEFRDSDEGATPVMIASGRADPGLLHFPKESTRGFDIQTTYAWDGRAFTPKRTEYEANEDYKIYQFISDLHLKDFRSAYALIDPAKLLKTDEPSLEIFRKHVEESWPEFLDDEIFEVLDLQPPVPGDFSFALVREGSTYVYHPQFAPGTKHLLTGLERREQPRGKD